VTTIRYGGDLPDETELHLCGDVAGHRVVELGVAAEPAVVAFAQLGARAIAIDPSPERIAAAHVRADAAEVRVELHQSELADLGFVTSASVDLVFSAGALDAVDDLPRVFRQVHRILKADGVLVLAVTHPISAMLEGGEVVLRRPYWASKARTVGALFTALTRANFLVDTILEPPPVSTAHALVPAGLVVRARKLGV
jgi:SAM-dependent methyltransferase